MRNLTPARSSPSARISHKKPYANRPGSALVPHFVNVLGVRYWHWLDSVLALALSYALEFGWTAEKLVAPNFIPWLGGYSRNESAASQRSSTFSVRSSSARVRPRLTAAIGMPRRAAIWTKRKPE
jgi:hypothetical protein